MRISSTKTIPTAASSSVPLIDSKTLIASAAKPAGPVTLTSSPPPGSLTSSRMSSIGSRIVSDSPSPVMLPISSAASPPGESCGSPNGETCGYCCIASLSSCAIGGDLLLVGLGQPALAAVDDDDRRLLAALQLLADGQRLGRLGVGRQERRRLVVLGVGVLAGQVRADHRDDRDAARCRRRRTWRSCRWRAVRSRDTSRNYSSSARSSSGSVTGRWQAKRSHT